MNENKPPFTDQLNQFGESQLANVSAHDLHTSTVQLLLATVFFTGAAISIAKVTNTPRNTYHPLLRIFLQNNFGLSAERATGMIESNARLYKRFVLIERIYHAGWNAARDWNPASSNQSDDQNNTLKELLKKYHNLSMSELNIEGTKEQLIEPPKAEVIPAAEPEVVIVTPPSQWRRNLVLILLVVLISAVTYLLFFTNLFPEWRSTMETVSEKFFAPLFEKLFEIIQRLLE